jgi:D-aspartate ligase
MPELEGAVGIEAAVAANGTPQAPAVAWPEERPAKPRTTAPTTAEPLACVLGNMNLIRALGTAGIRCAAVARPDSPPAFSRFVDKRIEWADNWGEPARMLFNLVDFADRCEVPPILFFQHDGDLMFVSRHREQLGKWMRFAIAEHYLVERLVDKARFAELAQRVGLPVPASAVIRPSASGNPPDLELEFPIIVKPLTRRDSEWTPIAGAAKALEVESPARLKELWPRLQECGEADFIAQELVPGEEDRIESYHAYVDSRGAVAAEFTGRKLRTLPRRLGDTTALQITDEQDVRDIGRRCMRMLNLGGVAKLDFKRAPDGRLFLLEINPRFNLWHLPGAVAGVNIPATVYADLAGRPRPAAGPARAGVTWSIPWKDLRARREWGMGLPRWLAWQMRAPTRHVAARDDPLPFARGMLWRHMRRRFPHNG